RGQPRIPIGTRRWLRPRETRPEPQYGEHDRESAHHRKRRYTRFDRAYTTAAIARRRSPAATIAGATTRSWATATSRALGPPIARRDRNALSVPLDREPLDRGAHPLAKSPNRGVVDAAYDEDELLAAVASDDVLGADHPRDGRGHRVEDVVARQVPARVVHLLE